VLIARKGTIDDELVIHEIVSGRRLHGILLVRILVQTRTLARRLVVECQRLATHAFRYVESNARLQQSFADLEQEEDDLSRQYTSREPGSRFFLGHCCMLRHVFFGDVCKTLHGGLALLLKVQILLPGTLRFVTVNLYGAVKLGLP